MEQPGLAAAQAPSQLRSIFGEETLGPLAGGLHCVRSLHSLSRLQLPEDLPGELPSLSNLAAPPTQLLAPSGLVLAPPLPQPPLDILQVSSCGSMEV